MTRRTARAAQLNDQQTTELLQALKALRKKVIDAQSKIKATSKDYAQLDRILVTIDRLISTSSAFTPGSSTLIS